MNASYSRLSLGSLVRPLEHLEKVTLVFRHFVHHFGAL